jgi:hypothetical protein
MPMPVSRVSFQLTEEQWAAIRSVRTSWPDHIDWIKVRDEIEKVGQEAQQMRHNRRHLGPPVKIRDNLRRVLRLNRELQAAMTSLPELLRESIPDLNLEGQDRRLQSWLDR